MGNLQSTTKSDTQAEGVQDEPSVDNAQPSNDAQVERDQTMQDDSNDDRVGGTIKDGSSMSASTVEQSPEEETFKIPSLPSSSSTTTTTTTTTLTPLSPNSTSLKALPADIEHILSLGVESEREREQVLRNAVQASRGNTGREGEIESVVKELREKYKNEGGGNGKDGDESLKKVEEEMEKRGIVRGGDEKEGDGIVKMDQDSDSSSSSDEDNDSDSTSSGNESDTTTRNQKTKRTRGGAQNGRRQGRAASMSDGGDSSDEEGGANGTGGGRAPKTEHELAEPEPSLPQVDKIDEELEIAKFGKVESVIETVVVVKADTSGDWRVLDEGTVVCWEDRTVIGTIFETFGSVQQPFYSLRFPSSSPPNPSTFTLQRPVFYAPSYAQFVFTRDLRSLKGSDASNVWDEEVAGNEIEFSDDEEEAEYKRKMKQERKNRNQSSTPAPSSNRSQSARQPSNSIPPPHLPSSSSSASRLPLPQRPAVSYADSDDPPIASTSSSSTASQSIYDLYGSNHQRSGGGGGGGGPKVEMGERPPRGRVGKKMFERDTGMELEVGEEVEFEFSSGDEEDGEKDSEEEGGGGRVRELKQPQLREQGGRGRGRNGRGGSDGSRGRGRGRGGGQDRGGGRGGRGGNRGGGGRGGRNVAPLPARASPQGSSASRPTATGLPPRPTFDVPVGTSSEERMSIDASQAPAFAPPIRFGEPTTFGGITPSSSSTTTASINAQPQSQQRSNPPPPPIAPRSQQQQQQPPSSSYSSHYQQPYPYQSHPQQQQSYHAPPLSAHQNPYYRQQPPSTYPQPSYITPQGGGGGGYSPHQPQAAFPPSTGIGGAGGHVNPRFFAQQQQGGPTQPPGPLHPPSSSSSRGQYGGYGGYGGAGGYGGTGGGY